jgi:arsenite methyltransferase
MSYKCKASGDYDEREQMTEPVRDKWAQWLLHRGAAGDPDLKEDWIEFLRPVRDKVLQNAALSGGEALLDVGAGDGLIAFGALELLGEHGRVVFNDVSQDLLDHSRILASEKGLLDRCRFVRASAEDLGVLEDASVDVVTTRSVLIYVEDKRQAFEEFHRVLKPGGRLSIFEPISSFAYPEPPDDFRGCDVSPVRELAAKVKAVYEKVRSTTNKPMLDFDERDLISFAEVAGFKEIHLEFRVEIAPGNPPG